MIKVVTNNLGSGDWVAVVDEVGEIWSGHSIRPSDLVTILRSILEGPGIPVGLVELTDEQMEAFNPWQKRNG